MKGFQSNLMKEGGEIPLGHYEQENMRLTVVPGRNSIFATILLGLAQSTGAEEVWFGVHAGDHHIYVDCRPEWLDAISNLYGVASEGTVSVRAPYLNGNKITILARGLTLGVPYQLTRTCYQDQELACGKCGSCTERLEAFRNNEIPDPITYAL